MRCDSRDLDGRSFDLLVIGGGLQGAAIAREAASRDATVLLVDAGDFGGNESARSSGLLSSGFSHLGRSHSRFLMEVFEERERLVRLSPHLARPAPVLVPSFRGGFEANSDSWSAAQSDSRSSRRSTLPESRELSAEQAVAAVPELRMEGLDGAVLTYDAVVVGGRLALANLQAAVFAGAAVLNYCEVTGVNDDGHVVLRDVAGQCNIRLQVSHVVNATGAAVDVVREKLGVEGLPLVRMSRTSRLVLGPRSGETAVAVVLPDGHLQQFVPHLDGTVWGAADVEVSGRPDGRATVDAPDLEYLLEGLGYLFASPPTPSEIQFAVAGWRPVPIEAGPADGLSRAGFLIEEPLQASTLHNVIGGELATHRSLAERVVAQLLGVEAEASPTRTLPLPGGEGPREVTDPLWWRHGGLAADLRAMVRDNPEWGEPICRHRSFLKVEAVHALQNLAVVSFADLMLRRLIDSRGPCLEEECLKAAHHLFSAERQWPVDGDFAVAQQELERIVRESVGEALEDAQASAAT